MSDFTDKVQNLKQCQDVAGVFILDQSGNLLDGSFESKDLVPKAIMAMVQNAIAAIKQLDESDEPRIIKLVNDQYEYQIAPENEKYTLIVKKV